MRRIVRPEILDTDQASPKDVHDSLVDLQRINRWFGGITTTGALIDIVLRETGRRKLTVLDVASATGDIPRTIQRKLRSRGVELRYTLLDRDPGHFDGETCATMIRGDALSPPFNDNSFDLVTCSLFVHHLEPEQIRTFAEESLHVCRVAVLINDLRRSYLHLAAVYAGKPLFRRITRHDSVASVWRSYTPGELRDILNHAAARKIDIRNSYLFRMGIIVWK